MQMCLYSIEWYARQNCPRAVVSTIEDLNNIELSICWFFFQNGPLDYFVPRSFFCRDGNDTMTINAESSSIHTHFDV